MKTIINKLCIALVLLALATLNPQLSTVFAQGTTAFTYQGRLNISSGPANGSYDMTFAVYDAAVTGNFIAGPITNSAVAVSNGLFTVTLDFGAGVFTGTNYWVEMAVSTNGAGNFTTLAPRQQLTPAPYAISLVSPQATALCPPGSIMAYMGTNAPNGWLMCDGTAYPTNQYPALFAVLGSSCGASGTTFNVPDCRGIFLRGVNGTRSDAFADPDDNTTFRTNVFTGGNSGNEVGSYQADQIVAHNHIEGTYEGSGPPRDIYGSVSIGSQLWGDWQYSAMGNTHALTSTVGGNETRPKNIYVNYIIKY
jgi:hypothetical protein